MYSGPHGTETVKYSRPLHWLSSSLPAIFLLYFQRNFGTRSCSLSPSYQPLEISRYSDISHSLHPLLLLSSFSPLPVAVTLSSYQAPGYLSALDTLPLGGR